MLAEILHSTAQLLARGLPARSASENPSDALRRIGERTLEPVFESFFSKRLGLILGGDFEERVNPCLDRSFMQKVAAEGVNRPDTSEFQLLESTVQPVALLGCSQGSRLFDLAPQAKLHLSGRLFCEGDRHDSIEGAGAGADQPNDPAN